MFKFRPTAYDLTRMMQQKMNEKFVRKFNSSQRLTMADFLTSNNKQMATPKWQAKKLGEAAQALTEKFGYRTPRLLTVLQNESNYVQVLQVTNKEGVLEMVMIEVTKTAEDATEFFIYKLTALDTSAF